MIDKHIKYCTIRLYLSLKKQIIGFPKQTIQNENITTRKTPNH